MSAGGNRRDKPWDRAGNWALDHPVPASVIYIAVTVLAIVTFTRLGIWLIRAVDGR